MRAKLLLYHEQGCQRSGRYTSVRPNLVIAGRNPTCSLSGRTKCVSKNTLQHCVWKNKERGLAHSRALAAFLSRARNGAAQCASTPASLLSRLLQLGLRAFGRPPQASRDPARPFPPLPAGAALWQHVLGRRQLRTPSSLRCRSDTVLS